MFFRNTLYLLGVTALTNAGTLPTRSLGFDDVLVLREDGSAAVMKEAEYMELRARTDVQSIAQSLAARSSEPNTKVEESPKRRGCKESIEIQVTSDTTLLSWDVAMSPVVSAAGSDTEIGISRGYSISNTLEVNTGVDFSPIEEVLTFSFGMSYSETWETDESTDFTFTIPDGQYGLVVSEPWTRRMEGNYLSGCTDSWKKQGFVSDTYTSQTYGNLNWVTGVIRLCNSSSYPVPYCIGTGSHY